MTKKTKPTYDGEWDCSYPLIELTDMNRPVVLNDERFWGKRLYIIYGFAQNITSNIIFKI